MAQLCASVQPLSGLFDKGLVGLDLTREWDSSTKLLSGWYFIGMCHFFGESSKAHTPSSGNRYLVPLSSLTSMESGFIPFVATQCRSHSLLGCVNALFLLFLLENSLLWTHCWFSAPWWLSVIGGHHVADQHVCIMHHHKAPAGAWLGGKGMFNAKNFANTACIFCLLLPSASWPCACSVL